MIYLDYAATTPVDPAVLAEMMPLFGEEFGNVASPHGRGRAAEGRLGRAREQVAALLGVRPSRVVFTSGATEALNTAIKGVAAARPGHQLVVGATEHKAALEAAARASKQHGSPLITAPVDSNGVLDLAELQRIVTSQSTAAVIVMAANNETGVLNPVPDAARIAREADAVSIVDVTQQAGRAKVALEEWGVDFAAASAHKVYGPQGVGALVVPAKRPLNFEALLHGGDHERGWRSGTTNLPGVVGFGAAAELAQNNPDAAVVGGLGRRLEDALRRTLRNVVVHSDGAPRLPGFVNVWIPEVDADALLASTPGLAFATGSACTSATPSPSHVLVAMGVPRERADESIRLTVGRYTTPDEVDEAVDMLGESVRRLRALQGVQV